MAEGEATIVSISKPETFTPDVEFRVRPTFTNVGDAGDTLFLKLINKDTDDILGEQEIYVSAGRNWVPSIWITLTQTTDFYGRLEVGHIQNGTKVVDDTEDFTIPVEELPPETILQMIIRRISEFLGIEYVRTRRESKTGSEKEDESYKLRQ